MKEILERLDRIEKLLLAGGDRLVRDGRSAEREWTVGGRVVAKLRMDGGLELYDGPHKGLWTLEPGSANKPLTPKAIEALASEAVAYARRRAGESI